jgi:hypothetical protein
MALGMECAEWEELFGFLDLDHFAALIVAAFGAGAVRHFLFVAVGAFR